MNSDLAAFDRENTRLMARYRDVHDAMKAAGWASDPAPEGPFAGAVVFAPRSREAQRAAVSSAWAKAHGKLFTVTGGDFSDWPAEAPAQAADGWWRAPGVFSEGRIDRASAHLAELLPAALPGSVADLGAGWGYLSGAILAREGVETVHLVENDRVALEAARRNLDDGRAVFHWADATRWSAPALLDHVVTNPPFHTERKAEPELGRAFIRAAAAMLKPKGGLWLVANRHLPYEAALEGTFRELHEVGGDPGFKVIHATRPRAGHRTGKTR